MPNLWSASRNNSSQQLLNKIQIDIVRPLFVFVKQISREQSIRCVDKFFAAGIIRDFNEEVDPLSAELFGISRPHKWLFLIQSIQHFLRTGIIIMSKNSFVAYP